MIEVVVFSEHIQMGALTDYSIDSESLACQPNSDAKKSMMQVYDLERSSVYFV